MKTIKFIIFAFFTVLLSCQKDPMTDVNEGYWQKQKDIIEIKFEGQIGTAEISREENLGTIAFMFDLNYGEISSVKLAEIVSSYGSQTSVLPGDSLDFSVNNRASITVTPRNGEPMVWEIILTPFREPLVGVFNVRDLRVLIDVISQHPDWGGHTKNDPITNYLPEASTEYDNIIRFVHLGINAQGNSFGTFTHEAGSDGVYGSFTNNSQSVNLNVKYRVLPIGLGYWSRNPSDNTLTFTDAQGNRTNAVLIAEGDNFHIRFEYVVETDWGNLWNNMTQIRQMTRYFWYVIAKE